jgi:hypothetical protein
MAVKTLKLTVAGKEIAANLESKISKDDLYGRVVHIVDWLPAFIAAHSITASPRARAMRWSSRAKMARSCLWARLRRVRWWGARWLTSFSMPQPTALRKEPIRWISA